MSQTRPFTLSFSVSDEFVSRYPEVAEQWLVKAKENIAKTETAIGPRGGVYRLVTPPDRWRVGQDHYDAMRGHTRYMTRRQGRYVRPSRAPRPPESIYLETLTVPVSGGSVTLPNGALVQTDMPFVAFPVVVR